MERRRTAVVSGSCIRKYCVDRVESARLLCDGWRDDPPCSIPGGECCDNDRICHNGFRSVAVFFKRNPAVPDAAGCLRGQYRALLVLKGLRRSVRQIVHPGKVEVVRVNGRTVDEKVLQNTNAYLAAYALIVVVSFLLISIDGFSITTNLSAVLACFNNIGPGLELVGPTCNFGGFSVFSKLVLILDMLAGRLEIFPILILFSKTTWGKR